MIILDVGLALIYILASLIVLFCLDISLHYLTSGRFTRAPLVFTGHILKCLMSHQGGPDFYFVTQCVSISTKGWCMESSLQN